MEEKDILTLAVIITVIGLMILIGIERFASPPELAFGDNMIGPMESDKRTIHGRITDIQTTQKSTRFRAAVEMQVDVMIFEPSDVFRIGDMISAEGAVQREEGYILFADSITILES